jgi:basic membrane protein A and related proteins
MHVLLRNRWMTLLVFCLTPTLALASTKPAVIYSLADKYDHSVNQEVYEEGVVRYLKETGIQVTERGPASDAERLLTLRELAKSGYSPIVLVGNEQSAMLQIVADEFPKTQFTLLDGQLDKPNVRSILFKVQEGAFLVGALAAAESETGIIGFVGGMDLPTIHQYGCGFEQGAKYANPAIDVKQSYATSTPALAFADPVKGSFLAKEQFNEGVDIIFAAARGTGLGVYQSAADEGLRAIGSDTNQNGLYPKTMLTSMFKRMGQAAYTAWEEAEVGTWKPGVLRLGLLDNNVGWSLDANNQALISQGLRDKLEALRIDIVTGKLKIHDYRQTNHCDYIPPKVGAICPPPGTTTADNLCKS